jgi:hypothetical protein
MLAKVFQFLGLKPTDEEQKILDAITPSMHVRGHYLFMDAKEARQSEEFKRVSAIASEIVNK